MPLVSRQADATSGTPRAPRTAISARCHNGSESTRSPSMSKMAASNVPLLPAGLTRSSSRGARHDDGCAGRGPGCSARQLGLDGLYDHRVLGGDLRPEAGHHLARGGDEELLEVPRDV